MNFDLAKILESKRALRKKRAAMPIEEKLKILDALRDRTQAIRGAKMPPPRPEIEAE